MRIAVVLVVAVALSARGGVNDPPPRAALIALSAPDANGEVSLTGAKGAAPANASVVAVNLDTGNYATAQASSDGAFAMARLFAPAGTFVLIKADPGGAPFDPRAQELVRMAGTILHVPHADPSRFAGASQLPVGSATWRFDGTAAMEAGELVVRGTVLLDTPAVDTAAGIKATPLLTLERFTLADGSPVLAQSTFASTFVTPTGFPLERSPNLLVSPAGPQVTLQRTAAGRAEAAIEARHRPPIALGAGWYRPVLGMRWEGVPPAATSPHPVLLDPKTVDRASRKSGKTSIYGPLMKIGDPAAPRTRWMLLANHASEGTRGTVALEDRAHFAFAPRVAAQANTLVVPRGRYNLEPFAPLISLGDRELPSPPLVPFRFPSGSLRVEITHPDGRTTSTPALPFAQSRSINMVSATGLPLETGGGYPHDPYQLSTMDPAFEIDLAADGRYTIRLEGWVNDMWGNRWSGGGTYEVTVAKLLVLDTAVLPGTPFEAGDVHSAEVQIVPPVGAEVEVRVTLDGNVTVRRGRANRFGRFRVDGIPLPRPGEYRADVVATYRDENGDLYAGARSWGNVVAPRDSDLVAHGNRGVDDMPHPRPIWYRLAANTGSGHIQYPFLGGDVLWAVNLDAAIPHVTFDDPGRKYAHLFERGGLRERYLEGSTPPQLMTSTSADAHLDPTAINVWSYAYRSVQRPLVRVREIAGEESGIAGYYWRFNSAYGGQRGNGVNGDLPNDFKFQFGGVVLRGSAIGAPQYAIYGSFFVLVRDGDPDGGSRVLPPFQGNGGGPNGGPLFRLKGKPIDLFFHPTALRPGSIVHRGEPLSLAGYVAPTLPAKIEAVFTAPSGETRTIRGRANLVGWFHDPAQDFVAGESGVWKAKVTVVFDGATSAGQVSEPYPTGDVLGSREGEFFFYVVDATSAPLQVAGMPPTVRPADGPITFRVTPPPALTDAELTYTTTMPGFILEEGTTTAMRYTYDAPRLALDFPNLDLRDGDGKSGVDVITISLLASGTDATGAHRHFARQIVLDGEELHMPAQQAQPKRRAAR